MPSGRRKPPTWLVGGKYYPPTSVTVTYPLRSCFTGSRAAKKRHTASVTVQKGVTNGIRRKNAWQSMDGDCPDTKHDSYGINGR